MSYVSTLVLSHLKLALYLILALSPACTLAHCHVFVMVGANGFSLL